MLYRLRPNLWGTYYFPGGMTKGPSRTGQTISGLFQGCREQRYLLHPPGRTGRSVEQTAGPFPYGRVNLSEKYWACTMD